ncbi:hypothetical protein RDV78_08180 [Bacillota bacterium LX-D]|nr:hypothetical protein [Bacillota bacterium LX-D]
MKTAFQLGCHLEITALLITGLNDSIEEIKKLTQWIATTLGPDIPVYFTRYFPNYQLDLPATP